MAADLHDGLGRLGFARTGASRRGGVMWTLQFNRHLQFHVHEFAEALVVTWSFDLGRLAEERGWQFGGGDATTHELYPRRDSRIAREVRAVEGEITRVLATLRLDLGDPTL